MKEKIRRLTKDGECRFEEGKLTREQTRAKAQALVKAAAKEGYTGYGVYRTAFGYYMVRYRG